MRMRSAPSRRRATSSIPRPPSACSTTSIRPAARAIRKRPMSPSVAAIRSPTPSCAAAGCWSHQRPPDESDRQIFADYRQEEDRAVDGKAEVPQDRAERRPVAEIGEDVGDANDHEQHRQLVDIALRAAAEFGQQHGNGEKRKRFDAVLVRAERTCGNRVLEKTGIARLRIVEAAK